MSGIIEPADPDGSAGVPAGTRATSDQVDPSIIPSLAEHARAGVGTPITAVFAAVGLVAGLTLLFVLWRLLSRPLRVDIPKPSQPVVASSSGVVKEFEPTLAARAGAATSRAERDHPRAAPAIEVPRDNATDVRGTGTDAGVIARVPLAPRPLSATAGNAADAPVLLTRPGSGSFAAAAGGASTAVSAGTADPVSQARESLAEYRHQLSRSLESLQAKIPGSPEQRTAAPSAAAAAASAPATGIAPPAQPSSTSSGAGGRGVLGMQASETPGARAGVLGDRSLVLPQGTSLTCALTTRVVSAQAGFIACQVLRNVYGADGRVLLIERGSHLIGEYRVTQVKPGSTRIPALWTRLRTAGGVTIDLDSPATGPLGEAGADAYVDNRWFERIGAAILVSILDDSLKIVLNNETAPQQGGNAVVFQSTAQTASKMAEKVLDATISLPPVLYANQGALVGVFVARDVDFSSVYELQPVAQ